MLYKKREVRRYVVRAQLFALPDPQRNAQALAALSGQSAKPAPSAPAQPRVSAAKE